MAMAKSDLDDFQIEWHGSCVVISPAANIEQLRWDVVENAAEVVMQPLKLAEVPTVIFDLSGVKYFGSVFLALLLRCHKYVKERGGDLVLCGPSQMARELLKVTALDRLWALYDTRQEALAALKT